MTAAHHEEQAGAKDADPRRGLELAFPIPEDIVLTAMHSAQVPGLAIGIFREGIHACAGFGVTSVENPLPVHADTLFQIGSISKTFTATAAMCLVERGKLELDAPIRTYLPDFRLADENAAATVTLRHLLTHSGGWEDRMRDTGESDDAVAGLVASLLDVPQMFAPGTNWSYSNTGLTVAGRVIEAVTGKVYDDALHELVLEPLGLDRTFLRPMDVMTYRFATGHRPSPSGAQVVRRWIVPRQARPAGGVITSARQLLRSVSYTHLTLPTILRV